MGVPLADLYSRTRTSGNDGTFRRRGKDGGRWWVEPCDAGQQTGAMVLAWESWPRERLVTEDGGKVWICRVTTLSRARPHTHAGGVAVADAAASDGAS